jgi:hypothetical protein
MTTPNEGSASTLRAYRVLDVPTSATAYLIRQRHRQLLKRWHPDLYLGGTPQHSEATQMAKLINEAYSLIQYAPLRYRSERSSSPSTTAKQHTSPPASAEVEDSDEDYPRLDRIEFWVRFVCGALLGLLASIEIVLYAYDSPSWIVGIVCLSLILTCAFASARFGDDFWGWIFGPLARWL